MLVLSRKLGESLVICGVDGDVVVRVQKVGRGRVSLAIDAPRHVPVLRSEIAADEEATCRLSDASRDGGGSVDAARIADVLRPR